MYNGSTNQKGGGENDDQKNERKNENRNAAEKVPMVSGNQFFGFCVICALYCMAFGNDAFTASS